MNDFKEKLSLARKKLEAADAVVVGAGAAFRQLRVWIIQGMNIVRNLLTISRNMDFPTCIHPVSTNFQPKSTLGALGPSY